MDKLIIATQVLLKLIETNKTGFDAEGISGYAWEITDAMQAEAEKRISKERPEALCEVDWRVAPSWAKYWALHDGLAEWFSRKPVESKYGWGCETLSENVENAPSFGFTGTHIMERPHGF